ncbi:MAG: DNA primase, partial [Rhodothermales bacterium]
ILHEPSRNWERKQRITVPKLDEDPYESAASAMTFLKLDRIEDALRKKQEEIQAAEATGANAGALHQDWMDLHDLRSRISRRDFLENE